MKKLRVATRASCVLWGLLSGCGAPEEPPADSPQYPAQVSKPAEQPVEVQVLNYEAIQALIAAHKGKVVVMDVWATTCPPCIEEFPGLVALHRRHGPAKVACISVSADFLGLDDEKPEDHLDQVRQFLQKQGAQFDNVISSESDQTLYEQLAIDSIPAVFVYGRGGGLVERFSGTFSYRNDIAPLVEKLLAQGTSPPTSG